MVKYRKDQKRDKILKKEFQSIKFVFTKPSDKGQLNSVRVNVY